jgi:hypothetical protein
MSNPDLTDAEHETISSARVEGTPVRNKEGEELGTIHSVMIHKRSGQVGYALLRLDTYLGTVGNVYPVPWAMLTYDRERHCYTADIDRDILENAPLLGLDEADRPSNRIMDQHMYEFWGIEPVW